MKQCPDLDILIIVAQGFHGLEVDEFAGGEIRCLEGNVLEIIEREILGVGIPNDLIGVFRGDLHSDGGGADEHNGKKRLTVLRLHERILRTKFKKNDIVVIPTLLP